MWTLGVATWATAFASLVGCGLLIAGLWSWRHRRTQIERSSDLLPGSTMWTTLAELRIPAGAISLVLFGVLLVSTAVFEVVQLVVR